MATLDSRGKFGERIVRTAEEIRSLDTPVKAHSEVQPHGLALLTEQARQSLFRALSLLSEAADAVGPAGRSWKWRLRAWRLWTPGCNRGGRASVGRLRFRRNYGGRGNRVGRERSASRHSNRRYRMGRYRWDGADWVRRLVLRRFWRKTRKWKWWMGN